ncbi:hypothetical protein GC167_08230 [bacterium]|nr:hypothetical protein [bacterium]
MPFQTIDVRSPRLHRFYLKITAFVVGSFGPIFFLGTRLPTAEPARWTLDFLAWPVDAVQTFTEPTTRFLSALTGGFLLGWGVTIALLSALVYDRAPEAVRRSVLGGILSWFALDSAGSIASDHPSNALFNVLVLLLAVGPLWWPAREQA